LELILAANDEGEFAAMLAQAMARAPLMAAMNGGMGTFYPYPGQNLQPLGQVRQMPAIELQADATAAQALSRAGLDPAALLHYIERLQPADRPNAVFNAMPPRDARIAALAQILRELPPAAVPASSNFAGIQERARPKADTQRPTLRRFE
jgi:predicted Zn-dependent protease